MFGIKKLRGRIDALCGVLNVYLDEHNRPALYNGFAELKREVRLLQGDLQRLTDHLGIEFDDRPQVRVVRAKA
jgi:hypothetical protein